MDLAVRSIYTLDLPFLSHFLSFYGAGSKYNSGSRGSVFFSSIGHIYQGLRITALASRACMREAKQASASAYPRSLEESL